MALAHAGFVRSFPRAVSHGPSAIGGLECPTIDLLQGSAQVTYVLNMSSRRNHLSSSLMRALSEQLKIEMGVNGPIFEMNPETFGHMVTNTLLVTLWRFIHGLSLWILDDMSDLQLLATGDRPLV